MPVLPIIRHLGVVNTCLGKGQRRGLQFDLEIKEEETDTTVCMREL